MAECKELRRDKSIDCSCSSQVVWSLVTYDIMVAKIERLTRSDALLCGAWTPVKICLTVYFSQKIFKLFSDELTPVVRVDWFRDSKSRKHMFVQKSYGRSTIGFSQRLRKNEFRKMRQDKLKCRRYPVLSRDMDPRNPHKSFEMAFVFHSDCP